MQNTGGGGGGMDFMNIPLYLEEYVNALPEQERNIIPFLKKMTEQEQIKSLRENYPAYDPLNITPPPPPPQVPPTLSPHKPNNGGSTGGGSTGGIHTPSTSNAVPFILELEDDPLFISGGGLDKFCVAKLREVNQVIWVCTVRAIPPGYVGRLTVGSDVLVNVWDIVNVSIAALTRAREYQDQAKRKKALPPNLQRIRIGTWNIRCTGEFQHKNKFSPELLQRFQRMADFIHYSTCDIVALQEFPTEFNHLELDAQLFLSEFIRKLDSVSGESWGFGYSDDFPQECWTGDRTIRNKEGKEISEYLSSNSKYVHAFVFKRGKIECHSVEQVLDVKYQENRFKHAPSLGRFTFMGNFHFTLVNVHLRPKNHRTDSRYEIKDLGDCIGHLSRFNPDSTIFLGDFNMSACRWAPDPDTSQSKCTEFPPYVDGVWDSFRDRNYTHVVQNRYTNTSESKQFDNIWLPEELKENHRVEQRYVVPHQKYGYIQSQNVCRLQEFFSGQDGKRLIDELTDHHLVFVDLEIDVATETENIKKIVEVGNGLVSRLYDGFHQPPPLLEPETELVAVSEQEPEQITTPEKVKEEKPKKTSEKKQEKTQGLDQNDMVSLQLVRSHFLLWNIMDTSPTVADMGGPEGILYWSKNIFPPDFTSPSVLGEEDKQRYDEMKRLEALYLEKKEEFEALEYRLYDMKETLNNAVSASETDKIKRTKNKIAKAKRAIRMKMDDILSEFNRLLLSLFPSHRKPFVKPHKARSPGGGEDGEVPIIEISVCCHGLYNFNRNAEYKINLDDFIEFRTTTFVLLGCGYSYEDTFRLQISRAAASKIIEKARQTHQNSCLYITIAYSYFAMVEQKHVFTPAIFFEPSGVIFENHEDITLYLPTNLSHIDDSHTEVDMHYKDLSSHIRILSTSHEKFDPLVVRPENEDIYRYPAEDLNHWYHCTDEKIEALKPATKGSIVRLRVSILHFSGRAFVSDLLPIVGAFIVAAVPAVRLWQHFFKQEVIVQCFLSKKTAMKDEYEVLYLTMPKGADISDIEGHFYHCQGYSVDSQKLEATRIQFLPIPNPKIQPKIESQMRDDIWIEPQMRDDIWIEQNVDTPIISLPLITSKAGSVTHKRIGHSATAPLGSLRASLKLKLKEDERRNIYREITVTSASGTASPTSTSIAPQPISSTSTGGAGGVGEGASAAALTTTSGGVSRAPLPPVPAMRNGHRFHVFLSHDWGHGERNHKTVSRVNKKLQDLGLTTWFDEDKERMVGNCKDAMENGINESVIVAVFITMNYIEKVKGGNMGDNCCYEFETALGRKGRKGSQSMIPIVMESSCKDNENWGSTVRALRNQMYIEMIDHSEDALQSSCDNLYNEIVRRINLS